MSIQTTDRELAERFGAVVDEVPMPEDDRVYRGPRSALAPRSREADWLLVASSVIAALVVRGLIAVIVDCAALLAR